MCIVAPLKYAITSYILYRNRHNYIQRGLQGPWRLQNSLQDYFTAKCDFLILRVRFKVVFFTHTSTNSEEYRIQNKLVGCPLGAPISYYFVYHMTVLEMISFLVRTYHFDREHWPRGYKTFSMLNSAEYKIDHAHKC